jgi:hypothetical protein
VEEAITVGDEGGESDGDDGEGDEGDEEDDESDECDETKDDPMHYGSAKVNNQTNKKRGPQIGETLRESFDGNSVEYMMFQVSGHCGKCSDVHELWLRCGHESKLERKQLQKFVAWTKFMYEEQRSFLKRTGGAFPNAPHIRFPEMETVIIMEEIWDTSQKEGITIRR